MRINTESPGILVISEWALPGWEATIDQENVPLLTANHALFGLYVPQGTHVITLKYTSLEVWAGLLIALATLLFAAVVAWRWRPEIPLRSIQTNDSFDKRLQEGRRAQGQALKKAQVRWLMIGLILLGYGLRVFLLGNQELRGDEAFSYLFARLPLADVIPELIDQGDPHTPLHYLMLLSD